MPERRYDMGLSLSEIEQRIKLHVDRHKLLTSNIANADTPEYKAKDINFEKALNKEVNGVAVTHEKHFAGKAGQSAEIIEEKGGAWQDGNNVELNEEIAKMSENKILHDFYIARFAGYVKKFKMAIKRGA
jgi:flagellar basal-body rod protein FlgB